MKKNKIFSRRFETKGFKNFEAFDDFIQKCLDLYEKCEPLQEYYDISGKYAKYLLTNNSTIPDLVIYNSKFNKNYCFLDYYGRGYNNFPRVKFILNSKQKNKKNKTKQDNKDEKITNEKTEIENKLENKEKEIINEKEKENKTENEEFKKDEDKEKKEQEKEKLNDEKKKNLNEESEEEENKEDNFDDDDYENLTNPTQFFTQIQSNQEKLKKEEKRENIIEDKKIEKNPEIKTKEENKEIPKPKNNILINPNTQNNIVEAETESLTFIETKKPKIENNNSTIISNQNNTNINNNIINQSKQNEKKIPMINPQLNIPMINPYLYMHNPFIQNPNLSLPLNYNLMNQFNYMNYQLDDDDEDDDPIFNNFNDDYSSYNPSIFLEKPALIVKKNLIDKHWFLMRNNKVVYNFNSVELLIYLGEQIRLGNKFENMSISDYQTDLFFKPSNLFDILRKNVPKLQRKYYHKMMELNLNKNQMIHQQLIMNNKKFNGKK